MKQALVLAGGGSKGAYQAGCIKALQELKIDFDIVTGTSIGALNGLLVVQEDYQALYNLWQNMTLSDIFKDPVNFDFSIESLLSQTNLIKPFFKSYINEKGADITPLKNIIFGLYNHDKAINSHIDYGIVTVKYPKLTPLEITKKEMDAPLVDYALASASCFPAFPVHHINNQNYIDGGYFDNVPISLALQMGADKIIAIELNQQTAHDYFLSRPNITFIRPSYDLGKFLDFNRDILDWRIQLGYYDTLKVFNKLLGYRYNFELTEFNNEINNKLYKAILKYEDTVNRSIVNKTITSSSTPLCDLLKQDTYLINLDINDYFIRCLELTMECFNYQTNLVYNIDNVCKEITSSFINNNDISYRNIPIKEIFNLLKNVSTLDVINYLYSSLIKDEYIEPNIITSFFLKEYLIALFIYTLNTCCK